MATDTSITPGTMLTIIGWITKHMQLKSKTKIQHSYHFGNYTTQLGVWNKNLFFEDKSLFSYRMLEFGIKTVANRTIWCLFNPTYSDFLKSILRTPYYSYCLNRVTISSNKVVILLATPPAEISWISLKHIWNFLLFMLARAWNVNFGSSFNYIRKYRAGISILWLFYF